MSLFYPWLKKKPTFNHPFFSLINLMNSSIIIFMDICLLKRFSATDLAIFFFLIKSERPSIVDRNKSSPVTEEIKSLPNKTSSIKIE